ncbi:transmembrane emp24 domain-containing protein 6-like [Clavelina lepadiformis]|uniref:GOLD domain-containing protein n=1 Tax=Clavelina lepadiformis TaxID=159417 RepID=A0ABP0FW37_CLALP
MHICFSLFLACLLVKVSRQEKQNIPDVLGDRMNMYESTLAEKHFEPFTDQMLRREFEAKIVVPRRRVECIFEDCPSNKSQLSFSFQCYSTESLASDGKVDAFLILPNRTVFRENVGPQSESSIEFACNDRGTYGFCLDNSHEKYADKIVAFQLSVFHKGFVQDLHNFLQYSQDTVYSLYDTLFQVAQDINIASQSVKRDKAKISRHYKIIKSNQFMVSGFSLASVIFILAVSYVQVCYVKRLINGNVRSVNGSCAARA